MGNVPSDGSQAKPPSSAQKSAAVNLAPPNFSGADSASTVGSTGDDIMDVSMDVDMGNPLPSLGGESEGGGDSEGEGAFSSDDTVPTVFRWEHGGRSVFVTGTFNGWSKQIPMHRSGNDFTYIHNLARGKHAFKFIVDDEWRFAPDQPTVADIEGRINNFIDVSDFVPFHGDSNFEEKTQGGSSSVDILRDGGCGEKEGEWSRKMPDIDEYTKEVRTMVGGVVQLWRMKNGHVPNPIARCYISRARQHFPASAS